MLYYFCGVGAADDPSIGQRISGHLPRAQRRGESIKAMSADEVHGVLL